MRPFITGAWWLATVLTVGLLCGLLLPGCGYTSGGSGAAGQSTATVTATSTGGTPTSTSAPTSGATVTPGGAHASVKIIGSIASGFQFVPATLTIRLGTTVTWINATSTPHTSTSDTLAPLRWDSRVINPEGMFSFTFIQAGTVHYHCSIHPSMHGIITVTA
jgi:plastocyanin